MMLMGYQQGKKQKLYENVFVEISTFILLDWSLTNALFRSVKKFPTWLE